MAEMDPYAILGVPRTAGREEIARAYRRLAKQHHPDAGAHPSTTMARINDAWSVLSSPIRRARWDRDHTVVHPPHWSATPGTPRASTRPPPPVATGSPSVRDSGWLAAAVAGAIVMGIVAVGIAFAAGATPGDAGSRLDLEGISLAIPDEWQSFEGTGADGPDHRVLAHLVSYEIVTTDRCLSFDDPCPIQPATVPPGEASVVITAWNEGTPPVPDPILSRPFGRDAERIIGGEPAAFELRRSDEGAIAWWQLSPPGFPDRWIEVNAFLGGGRFEQDQSVRAVDEILRTLRFTDR